MEKEEGEGVVRTSHHQPHWQSVGTEASRLGKGKGREWRHRGTQREPLTLTGDTACYDYSEPDAGLTKFPVTQASFTHSQPTIAVAHVHLPSQCSGG